MLKDTVLSHSLETCQDIFLQKAVLFYNESHNFFVNRKEVMNYIKENLDSYSSMIKSEVGYASTNDYFSRKFRTDHQVTIFFVG